MSSETANTPVLAAGHGLFGSISAFFARVAHFFCGVFETVQIGQMASVLHRFSDERLATLGITRDQIYPYAMAQVQGRKVDG